MKRQRNSIAPCGLGTWIVAAFFAFFLGTGISRATLVGHWTFEAGEELVDRAGNFPNLLLKGESLVFSGALYVTGDGTTASAWAVTDSVNGVYRGPVLTNKTLVVWVRLLSLGGFVNSGSALTLDRVSSDQFDGVVFSERVENEWMNGSTAWARTQDFDPGFLEYELNRAVMHAITYEHLAGGQIRVTAYRDGGWLGQYESGSPSRWEPGDAEVFFGIRNGTTAGGPGALDAFIHEARIYDTVLSQSELIALSTGGVALVADTDRDGLRDDLEFAHFGGLGESAGGDPDGDGLSNLAEFERRTNPQAADTDGDGLSDRVETGTAVYVGVNDAGTRATKADSDDDGIRDGDEVRAGTNPTRSDDPARPPVETYLVGHWTFEAGKELVDLTGNFPRLRLVGEAKVLDGRLSVGGSGSRASGWAVTDSNTGSYGGPVITNKTLMVWATLRSLGDVAAGGSLLTLDRVASDQFDGIVFGERQSNRWVSGSSFSNRTVDLTPGFEETTVGTPIHLAISYETLASNRVRVTAYRNGVRIGQYETGTPSSWSPGDAEVLFGIRNGDATGGGGGAVDALIDEARVYRQALNAAEIRRIFSPPVQRPVLTLQRQAGRIRLEWSDAAARLEGAPAVNGPWSVIANASTPYETEVGGGAARFFRLVK